MAKRTAGSKFCTTSEYWAFVAIKVWMRTVAGGAPPNFGRIVRGDPKRGKRWVRKSLGGPEPHETFEALEHDDPMRQVFRNPNGPDVAFDLWCWHYLYKKLTGMSHWYVLRNRFGVPVEIWVIPTHWTRMLTGHHGLPSSYVVTSPWGRTQEIPFDDVVTFYEHSPLNRWEGFAVNQAIGEWIDTYEANTRARLAQYKNGAIPAYHVSLGESYGDPDERQLDRYYSKLNTRFQGENRTGRPIITGADVEVKALGISPVDMGYDKTEDQIRDMTLVAYDVPKVIVGLMDSMTYGSVAAGRAEFYEGAVNPDLHYNGQVVSEKIVVPTPGYEDGVCFWDERTASDPDLKLKIVESRRAGGSMTVNEERTHYGDEVYEHGGDNPFIGGVEMPWATGRLGPPEQQLETAFRRAMDGSGGTVGGYLVAERQAILPPVDKGAAAVKRRMRALYGTVHRELEGASLGLNGNGRNGRGH